MWNIGGMIFNSRKLRYAEKNPSQCHFVHHKSHADSPGSNLGFHSAKSVGTGLPVSVMTESQAG
jgi:hypothetical protein